MATVGGLTSTTSNNIRGYGGLASGMDRDTLIEGMTSGTTSKITQQEQKKQKLEWQQEAVRAISDMMIAFANRYTDSLTSSNNLFSSMFWGRNNITTTGANSKYVSVTGTASAADAITIMGVKQMAQDAKWSSSESVSDMKLQTGKVGTTLDPNGMDGDQYVVQDLVGKSLEFKYGNSSYSVTLGLTNSDGKLYDYKTADGIADAINKQLANVDVDDNTKLSELVKFSVKDGKIAITGTPKGNELKMVGGSNSAMDLLGFESKDENDKEKEIALSGTAVVGKDLEENKLSHTISFAEKVAGKELTFSYNGTTKTIKMPSADELKGNGADAQNMKAIVESLQEQLNSAFGKNRIKVETTSENGLSFKTIDPTKAGKTGIDDTDTTSTLTLESGSSDLIGANGVLGIKSGVSNRVNFNESLVKAGLGLKDEDFGTDGNRTLKINDKEVIINKNDSVNTLMKKINESGAGVTISYQTVGDKFTFTSTEKGASGSINITAAAANGAVSDGSAFLNKIFGMKTDGKIEAQGQDAIVAVKYKGSDDVVELIRDSNSFTVDGLSVGVKGTFGYKEKTDADGKVVTDANGKAILEQDFTDPVEINAQVDTDKIVDNIKSMIDEYNKIIELVNKELTTRPDRDYAPLTSEQKKELSESEIETWETKAKAGLLYGDSDLRSLSSDLRFIMSGGTMEAFRKIGITTSTLYSENGKLSLDESKLRAALETDPESVEKLFTAPAGKDEKGSDITGMATKLKSVMDKYVKTLGSMESKGILIKKAGSKSSAMSLTENAMYKQLAEINKQISKLQTRLETERDRYIKQFTSLETLISQMNSQSSWLSQLGGY